VCIKLVALRMNLYQEVALSFKKVGNPWCRLMCADTTKCAHFLIRKGICDWNLRSYEQSMEHKDATITFSRRCN